MGSVWHIRPRGQLLHPKDLYGKLQNHQWFSVNVVLQKMASTVNATFMWKGYRKKNVTEITSRKWLFEIA